MFFSSEILSKRGPLAKVWLAAHVERKVSKAQTLQTSIPETVTVIIAPTSTMVSAPPLALRLSGQLLLGVARIYSKQAKYLLEDCNEASEKIRAAFRADTLQYMADDPAGEDHLLLPAHHNAAAKEAINLRTTANRNLFDFELEFGEGFGYGFGDGWEDFNLPTTADEILPIVGTSRSRIDADMGEITLPEHQPFDDTMEMEVGRDAPGTADRRSARHSSFIDLVFDTSMAPGQDKDTTIGDITEGIDLGLDTSMAPGPDTTMGDFHEGIDLGLDTGIAPGQDTKTGYLNEGIDLGLDTSMAPGQNTSMAEGQQAVPGDGQITPRATSPNPNPLLDPVDVTPRTSRRLAPHLTSPAVGAEGEDQQPSKKKMKHQHIDRVTELESADHLTSSLGTGLNQLTALDPPKFLPKDRYQLQHYRLMLDPSRHEFLPQIKEVDGERWLMAAPAGLCKELQDLFKFPAKASSIIARGSGKKRLRAEEQEQLESEHGRRAPSLGLGNEGGDFSRIDVGDETLDMTVNKENESMGIFGEDAGFQLEIDQPDLGGPSDLMPPMDDARSEQQQQPEPPLSEPSAPETRRQRDDGESSKLDVFDDSADSQLQVQALEFTSEISGTTQRTKWSKNTLKALSVLKTELTDRSQVLKFKKVSNNATRRAGAAFFFELLVLGTRDCLKLSQDEAFGEIEVRSQDRLWEVLEQQAI